MRKTLELGKEEEVLFLVPATIRRISYSYRKRGGRPDIVHFALFS